ncbi:mCG147869 [Mus musculus]|nr:mCG147869 [Mus musculus]
MLFLFSICDHLCWQVLPALLCFCVWLTTLFPFWHLEFLTPVNEPLKEQQPFHDMGINLLKTQHGFGRALDGWKHIFLLKEDEPKMYLTLITIVLSFVQLIGWDGEFTGCIPDGDICAVAL